MALNKLERISSFSIISISILFVSCLDTINPPIRDESGKLVVEGMITNLPPPYTITLSTSTVYENLGELKPKLFSGATITITDDAGRKETLREISTGQYKSSPTGMKGQIGRSYQLEITLPNGTKYISVPEKLATVPLIDSVTIEYSQKAKGHSIYINTQDTKGERNYYRWSCYGIGGNAVEPVYSPPAATCRSVCWQYVENRSINILSDEFLEGRSIRRQPVFFAPFRSRSAFYVEINQLSLTRDAFRFWQLLSDQRNRAGSIFDPPPAPVNGNIYNANNPKEYALGYFAASAVDRRRLVINRDEIYDPLLSLPLAYIGRCCDAYANSSQDRPDWRD